MKKNRLKINKHRAKNSEKCPDQISTDVVHPPLFSNHTWTECVPISVKYLISITNIIYNNFMQSDGGLMILKHIVLFSF